MGYLLKARKGSDMFVFMKLHKAKSDVYEWHAFFHDYTSYAVVTK